MTTRRLIVAGSLAQAAGRGGHSWALLQYILGFRQLGWHVLFVDRLEPHMLTFGEGATASLQESDNMQYLSAIVRRFGLKGSFAVVYDQGRSVIGMERSDLNRLINESALMIDINGYLAGDETLGQAKLRVFLDIDPGFFQMWHASGLHDAFRGYQVFVTIAENINRADCEIPRCGIQWMTTRQPIVLNYWPVTKASPSARWTSVCAWRGPFEPVVHQNRRFGLRAHEFRKFMRLPELVSQRFELALEIHPGDWRDADQLHAHGWATVSPRSVAGSPQAYQRYLQNSRGEFMVAKNMYVDTRSGWFSDRSICYLASGRPVVAQETGFSCRYSTGQGLLAFSSLEQAAEQIRSVEEDYDRHSSAARCVAEHFFDSDTVLTKLLQTMGVA